uniref:SET domain-containing protein n=1 Tax=Grammatophora oceanica TaxID=210454 RepID=A0A7S1Y805_9STRA
MTNADWNHGAAYHRQSLGEIPGKAHPGRGSSTDFYNVSMYSKSEIRTGGEIFVDYGENWADEAEDEESETLQKIDYDRLDEVVDQIIDFMEKWKHELDSSSKKQEVYDFIVRDILSAAAGPKKGPKLMSLLPSDPEQIHKVKEAGGALLYSEPDAIRDSEWLESNGLCLDNIAVGASTIEGAGRGAFATRDLKKGSTVAPVPLVHLADKTVMDIYEVEKAVDEDGSDMWIRKSEEPVGKQLLLNYCYGHRESSVLLYPAAPAVTAINHALEPNAKLVWSEHAFHHKDWLEASATELSDADDFPYIGLMMEIVATRDIAKGEEIFIDYGPEWQAAWDQHFKDWATWQQDGSVPKEWPLRSLDLNEEYRDKAFPTKTQLDVAPLPSGVRQMCFLVVKANEEGDGKVWVDKVTTGGTTINSDNLFDCTIDEVVTLEEGSFNYTVQWDNEEDENIMVYHVPHSAIVFVDDAEQADEMNPKAFRHNIGVPDDVFPTAWKNLA